MSRLIVLDLDGTLLRDDKTVSAKTINMLMKVKEKGNKILFATARPPRDAYKYVPNELKDNPIICYNGACIIDGKKILYQKEMQRVDVLKIINIANQFSYNKICLEINDVLYSNFDTSDFFGNAPTNIVNLKNLEFKTVYKIIICSKVAIGRDFVDNLPKSCKGMITDGGTLCQIMNSQSSKWKSIEYLSKDLDIEKENVVAFGDDYNDLDMIKNAGIGIAMGNAEKNIKEIADFITESNKNDGIANYIEKYILGEKDEVN